MGVYDYKSLKHHVGHNIACVEYGNQNVAVECEDCNDVLIDFDREVSDGTETES